MNLAARGKRNVLLWHWGQVGAGAKFTAALGQGLAGLEHVDLTISAAVGSDLARLAPTIETADWRIVRTFEGDRSTLAGKLAAARGLGGLARLSRDYRRMIDQRSIDIAVCAFQSIWDVATFPLRSQRTRFVLVLHDATLHPGDWYPMRGTIMARQAQAADALIVLSDHVKRAAIARFGFPAERIWVVPHGAMSYGAPATARALPRARPVRLLFLGRITKYKGLGLLLDAYRRLREEKVPVELGIVGSGDMSAFAPQLQQLEGVSVLNRWVSDDEIARALADSDIVVLPYLEASQSGVAAAALTAGIPMVATPVGGLVEQVRHDITGLVAPGMAAGDLAGAIRQLASDPALYARCSIAAIETTAKDLDWSRIARRVGDILEDVIAQPPRRGARTATANA